ncbi:large conductance mechanosensitive channel protein MscL [Roseococcus pinisoli]|uniref:Large-conductance mechanosensitive channel n=1 Tax=Roseococcus pinisoli TaxID=2835040 RepID=A0ABS5QIH1_9PROT|nr:large conductance mechanosensitive channel protein MscL [Roseococcus pinisoli]MBS7813477.1 large conductance mechanosensitive channel protein MscL [Roseococcus pinisoli]
MPPPISIPQPQWLRDFKSFLMRGNVIDLAVGVVIGAAFTAVVSSVVEDLINPLIGLLVGGIDFSNLFVVLSGERQATLEATRQGGAAVIGVGRFINAVIKFTIVGFAVFWLVRVLMKIGLESGKKSGPSPTEQLLTEIRDELKVQNGREGATPPPAA